MSNHVEVDVCWATSAGDYVPFTTLPKAYHGKRVAIVIIEPGDTVMVTRPIVEADYIDMASVF